MFTHISVAAVVLLVLLAGAILSACQPVEILNSVTPRSAFTLETDLAYGDHVRQKLDIYFPRDRPRHKAVIVFIYGGSWEDGDKKEFLFVGQAFARLGYVTVIPNYRLYPEVEFPEFIDDVALAVARLPSLLNSACPHGREVILMGHSAGAHTAAMVATDPRYLQRNGAAASRVVALIGLAGPYDLPLEHERVVDKFTGVEGDEANPLALATTDSPPSLLLHGEADTIAEPRHTARFRSRLEELDVPVTVHLYSRTGHVTLLAGLASPLRFLNPAYRDIERFLAEQLRDELCT